MPDIGLDFLQWLYVALIAPVLGWLGGVFGGAWKERRKSKAVIKHLCGLPPECKKILIEFFESRSHTLRGDPLSPPVRLLINQGIVVMGPGGGTYDAVDRYLSVVPHVWKVMEKWAATDEFVLQEMIKAREEELT